MDTSSVEAVREPPLTILVGVYSDLGFWNLPAAHVRRLQDWFPEHAILHATSAAQTLELIPEADVILMSELRAPQFAAARKVRWIHSPAAGVGGMLFPELVASPVILTNSRGLGATTIAEHVLAVTLAVFRRLPMVFASQQERRWAQAEAFGPPGPKTIAGARALVIGMGAIGQEVARHFVALGAAVTGIRRRAAQEDGASLRIESPGRLLHLLPEADVVVIAAPLTRETRHLIGTRELAAMRADALVVNVSRGKIIDETALIRALADNTIGGAALDVFEHEPLAADNPLWSMPNVLITPHMAGFRSEHWNDVIALFAENLRRFVDGRDLLNVVDKVAGY